jgi:hypothetical protein
MIFEMVNGLEICILCCIAFVGMIIRRLRLVGTCMAANESDVISDQQKYQLTALKIQAFWHRHYVQAFWCYYPSR